MKKLILSAALMLSAVFTFADPGDTTVVRAIDDAQMTWYGNYRDTAVFPDGSTSYNKILMVYTMGCADNGCSDWDYTTAIHLYEPTGVNDSSIASIDTISTNPLVIDTTWNVFEVKRIWEMGRVITPYGGYMRQGSAGYDNSWEHPFVFDVTDFAHLLKDTVAFSAIYKGWSSGFSATVDFIFIEGTPARPVVQMDRVYHGYGQYRQTATFESTHLPPTIVDIHADAKEGEFRFTPTGHGFVNSLNCAEFCNRHFTLFRDGNQVARHDMWRDDCGMNPIYPQGGTWLYDRANWCPGDDAPVFIDNIGSLVGVDSVELNIDIEAYSYTVPQGETPAGYELHGVLVQYDDFQISIDAEVSEIIAPNKEDEYRRFNPACREAIIKITNRGENPLTSATIRYGIPGSWIQHTGWTGNLAYGESEIVTLPMNGPWPWNNAASGEFMAAIDVANDEVAYNNEKHSEFEIPNVHPGNIIVTTRTNLSGNETHWELYNDAGVVIASRDNLSSSQFYYDTLDLPSGCYEMRVMDRGKDGLAWWANNDGSGYVQLRNNGGTVGLFKKLPADFGTEYRYFFTIDGALTTHEYDLEAFVDVAPNPSADGLFEMLYSGNGELESWSVIDLQGRVVRTSQGEVLMRELIDLSSEANGMYILQLQTSEGVVSTKLVRN